MKMIKMISNSNQIEKQSLFYSPQSFFVECFNFIGLLFLLILLLDVPFFIAKRTNSAIISKDNMPIFEIVFDCLYMVYLTFEIYANIKLYAVIEEGILIDDPEEIFNKYEKKNLYTDFLSWFPFAFIALLSTKNIRLYSFLRIFRLLQVKKFFHFSFSTIQCVEKNIIKQKIGENFLRVFFTILVLLYSAHICSCGFILVGYIEIDHSAKSWIVENSFQQMSYIQVYFRGLYTVYIFIFYYFKKKKKNEIKINIRKYLSY
jgi:hypothetical protein